MKLRSFHIGNFDYPEITVNSDFVELRRTIGPPPDDHYQEASTQEHVRYTHGEFGDLFRGNHYLKPVIEFLTSMEWIGAEPRNSKTPFGKLLATQLAVSTQRGNHLVVEKNGYKKTYLYACYSGQSILSGKQAICLNTADLKAAFPDQDSFINWFSKQNTESFQFDKSNMATVLAVLSSFTSDCHIHEQLEPINLGLIEEHVKSSLDIHSEQTLVALKEFATVMTNIPGVLSGACRVRPKGNKGKVFSFEIEVTDSLKEDEFTLARLLNLRLASLYKKDDIKVNVVNTASQFDKSAWHFFQADFEVLYKNFCVYGSRVVVNTVTVNQVLVQHFLVHSNEVHETHREIFMWQDYFDRHQDDKVSEYLQSLRLIK